MAKRRSPADLSQIINAILRESDRGCVLVSAAWLEDILRMAICRTMSRIHGFGTNKLPTEERDAMERALLEGALNRAANRIVFCRLAGLISAPMAAAMESLFTLRNQHFAHFAGPSRLTDPAVQVALAQFTKAVDELNRGNPPNIEDLIKLGKRKYSNARKDFMAAYASLLAEVYMAFWWTDLFTKGFIEGFPLLVQHLQQQCITLGGTPDLNFPKPVEAGEERGLASRPSDTPQSGPGPQSPPE